MQVAGVWWVPHAMAGGAATGVRQAVAAHRSRRACASRFPAPRRPRPVIPSFADCADLAARVEPTDERLDHLRARLHVGVLDHEQVAA